MPQLLKVRDEVSYVDRDTVGFVRRIVGHDQDPHDSQRESLLVFGGGRDYGYLSIVINGLTVFVRSCY